MKRNMDDLKKSFLLLLISSGVLYLLVGIAGLIVIAFLAAASPVELVSAELLGLTTTAILVLNLFFSFLLFLGLLSLVEAIALKREWNKSRTLGKIIGILQIWIIPLGTFIGYLLITEKDGYK